MQSFTGNRPPHKTLVRGGQALFSLAIDYLQQKHYARRKRRVDAGKAAQWFLLYGQAESQSLRTPNPATLRKLLPPEDRSWMDPFLWKRDGQFYVFCEEWLSNEPHA